MHVVLSHGSLALGQKKMQIDAAVSLELMILSDVDEDETELEIVKAQMVRLIKKSVAKSSGSVVLYSLCIEVHCCVQEERDQCRLILTPEKHSQYLDQYTSQ
jgi:hypothetical protein